MGINRAVVRTVANTSTGNQDITSSGFGTPKAYLIIMSRATTDGLATDNAFFCIGSSDGTRQRCTGSSSEHNVGTANTKRLSMSDKVIFLYDNNTGTVECEAGHQSFITDGIRINWTSAPSFAYKITVVLFGGSDLTAYVNDFDSSGSLDGEVDITDPGFEPDQLVIFSRRTGSFDDTIEDDAAVTIGFVDNGTSIVQGSVNFFSNDNSGTGAAGLVTSDSYAGQNLDHNVSLSAIEIANFDSSGFSAFTRNNASSKNYGYLALNYNSVVSHSVTNIDSATSTGDKKYSTTFAPSLILLAGSNAQSLDTHINNDDSGAFHFSAFDLSNSSSFSYSDDDGVTTTDTSILQNNKAIDWKADNGSAMHTGTLSLIEANGWTINFTAANGTTRKWVSLVIGGVTVSGSGNPSIPILTSSGTGEVFPKLITGSGSPSIPLLTSSGVGEIGLFPTQNATNFPIQGFAYSSNKKSYHYAVHPEQGHGWSENTGDDWIWPDGFSSVVNVIDDNDFRRLIVWDSRSGLPYVLNTHDGPTNSGLIAAWVDKKDNKRSGAGTEITTLIKLGEYIGAKQHFDIEHTESSLHFRPIDSDNLGASGYTASGQRSNQKVKINLYKDGETTASASSEDVPESRELVFDRHVKGNTLQLEIETDTSEYKLNKIESYLEVYDRAKFPASNSNSSTMKESDYQSEFGSPSVWISRGSNLLLNRASGSDLTGAGTATSGPDGKSNSALTISTAVELGNSAQTSGTLILWHKTGYSISGVSLTQVTTSGTWILSYMDGSVGTPIPASISLPVGDVFDVRLYSSALSSDAKTDYSDDVINNSGDNYLPTW